ncbi:MAG: hypothetical protein AAFV29_20820 [Myxococcota bacterium]
MLRPTDGPAPHSVSSATTLAEACLQRARALVAEHDAVLMTMVEAVARPPSSSPSSCRRTTAEAPFAAFEGWWVGQWGDMPVTHLWMTVAEGVQLVAIDDAGIRRTGINLHWAGTICGLVISPDGRERRHYGRFVAATGETAAHLLWTTPQRDYRERVMCEQGRSVYEIEERIIALGRARRGMRARYHRPQALRWAMLDRLGSGHD